MPNEPPPEQRLTYSKQFRRCGRATCPRCGQDQPGHGPYWYGYWREEGRLRSRYFGKQAPPEAYPDTDLPSRSWLDRALPTPQTPPSPEMRSRGGATPAADTDAPAQQRVRVRRSGATSPDAAGAIPRSPDPPGSAPFHDPLPSSALPDPALALRVRTLGGFALWRGAVAIPEGAWSRRKAAALFKCLLDAPAHRLGREEAADLLWPEAGPTEAANNLKVTIHHLRRILATGNTAAAAPGGGSAYLRSEGDRLWLVAAPGALAPAPGAEWWDAEAFAHAARVALATRESTACEEALALYTGEYLPDDRYESWATGRRDRLRDLHLALQVLLSTLYLEQQRPEEAIRAFQAVLTLDPCHEEAARALIRLYGAAGRQVDATRTYRGLVKALQADLGIGPDAATKSLHQDLLAGRISAPAPPQARMSTHTGTRGGGDIHPPSANDRRPQPGTDARSNPPAERSSIHSAPLALNQPALTTIAMAGTPGTWICRTTELAWLAQHLDRARSGHGGLALLRGAAGVGKSCLISAFLQQAVHAGALVLCGHAYRQEGQIPYGPLVDALRGYILAQPASTLALQCNPLVGGALLAVLPELARALPGMATLATLEPEAERHRLFAAVRGLLGEIARTQPVVLALDALHRADPTTIAAIDYLGRIASGMPLLIVGSYRPEDLEAGHPLAEPGRAAAGMASGEAILDLPPLDPAGTQILLSSLLGRHPADEDLQGWVWNKSRGNPFYAIELVAALRKAGALVLRGDRWALDRTQTTTVPSGVRGLIAGRVDRLDSSAANLLRICAVLGKEVDYPLLRQLCDLGEDRLLAALDAARAADLLVEQLDAENTVRYAFPHPLVPEAMYQSIPATRRTLLHARVGEALLACHAGAAIEIAPDLAWHFARAGDHERAARYAILAGERAAAAGALPEALAHYQIAREHLVTPGRAGVERQLSQPQSVDVDERLGDLRLLGGEFAAAQADFARARGRGAAPARKAELLRKEGVSLFRRGEYELALEAFAAATEQGGGDESISASIELSRGEVYLRRGEYEQAEASAHGALAALDDADAQGATDGSTLAIACADHLLGTVALDRGDHQTADHSFRRALARREQAGDQPGIAESWHSLGEVAYDRRHYQAAQDCFASGLAIRERIGDQWGIASSLHGLGLVARDGEDHEAAERQFRQALAIRERIGDQQGIISSLANLGTLALTHGNYPLAQERFAGSLRVAEQIGDQQGIAVAWHNLGRLAGARGEPSIAAGYSRQARKLAARIGFPALEARATLESARARLQAGRPRQAEALLSHARSLATEHHLTRTTVAATLLTTELQLAQHRHIDACATAAYAGRLAKDAGLPAEEVLAQALLARVLALGA